MDEQRSGAPHWDVIPSPELEQKASSWLRGMIRFIVESTDDADTTPERFERTLGITTSPDDNGGSNVGDSSDPNYHVWARVALGDAKFKNATLSIDVADPSARGVRTLVRAPDAAWVEHRLREAGFDLEPEYPIHGGRAFATGFSRGRVRGFIALQWSSRPGPHVADVKEVVMRWSIPFTL